MADDSGTNCNGATSAHAPLCHISRARGGRVVTHNACSPNLSTGSCVMWRIYTTFAHRSSSARKLLQRNIIFICIARGARSVRCILYSHQSDGCVRIIGFV